MLREAACPGWGAVLLLAAPAVIGASALAARRGALAEAANALGVTDTEIKIGQTLPYSGPASAYGQLGRVEAAYFRAINDAGGINGRKLAIVSLDDGFSPPKAVEQIRRLVEQERVAFIFNTLGTPINIVIRTYLNQHKIPHLFVAAGSARFADPEHFPWTIGWQPTLRSEANFYGHHILQRTPNGRIAVLYQNDDFGKELLAGLKEGLGEKASMVISEASYASTDPTVDSQVVALQGSGADILCLFVYAKQGAQAIRKVMALAGVRTNTSIPAQPRSARSSCPPASRSRLASRRRDSSRMQPIRNGRTMRMWWHGGRGWAGICLMPT